MTIRTKYGDYAWRSESKRWWLVPAEDVMCENLAASIAHWCNGTLVCYISPASNVGTTRSNCERSEFKEAALLWFVAHDVVDPLWFLSYSGDEDKP